MVKTLINGEWPIELLPHRAAFHEARPRWEWEHLHSMHANLKPGDVVIDVGSEEGDLPALFGTWIRAEWNQRGAPEPGGYVPGGVVLIEPSPGYWPAIRQTFEMNGLGPLASFAGFASDVSNVRGIDDFDDWPEGVCVGYWPPCADGAVVPDVGFCHLAQQRTLPQIRLDDLMVGNIVSSIAPPHVDAITIDVEGAEFDVLTGSARLLSEDRPLVWVSVHTDLGWMAKCYPGKGRNAVYALMESHGYVGVHLATDHEEHTLFYPSERTDVVLP